LVVLIGLKARMLSPFPVEGSLDVIYLIIITKTIKNRDIGWDVIVIA
jgi:hypothetical protein